MIIIIYQVVPHSVLSNHSHFCVLCFEVLPICLIPPETSM